MWKETSSEKEKKKKKTAVQGVIVYGSSCYFREHQIIAEIIIQLYNTKVYV
jgi:hypothetical protein